jgi:alpha-tubulin suppressor-like RCC1 family protein
MSAKKEIFNKLIVLNKLKEELLNEIKLLYVLNDNVFIVTNDDKVFALGNNNYGVLGFGNKREIKELTINKDSSNKQINYFNNNVLGRTKSLCKLYFSYISKTVKDTKG